MSQCGHCLGEYETHSEFCPEVMCDCPKGGVIGPCRNSECPDKPAREDDNDDEKVRSGNMP